MANEREFKGLITFNIKETHPDIKHVKDPKEELRYTDTYTFDTGSIYTTTAAKIAYIKRDLALVAGGGYNDEHIYNVKYEITEL